MFKVGDKIRAKHDWTQKAVVCGVSGDLLTLINPPNVLRPGEYLLRCVAVPSEAGVPDVFELCVRKNIESGTELDEG